MVRTLFVMGIVATLVGMSVLLVPILLPRDPWRAPVQARLDSPLVWDRSERPAPAAQVLFALAPVSSPRTTYVSWKQFTDYLGRKLSLSVGLEPRETHQEVVALLERSEVDLAFVCSGNYVRARRRGPIEALAVPKVGGSVTNQALIIVRKDSPFEDLDDLRGRSFAFTEPDSSFGSLLPTWQLRQKGEAPERFFSEVLYTHGHDRSIASVAYGCADAASVSRQVFSEVAARQPEVTAALRVIGRSAEFGASPIVAGPRASRGLRQEVRDVLLGMDDDGEGREVLKALGYDSFEAVSLDAYRPIEEMQDALSR